MVYLLMVGACIAMGTCVSGETCALFFLFSS